jgi:hypothetical protein
VAESDRDPFAAPGMPGNRSLRYGADGPVPALFRPRVDIAIDLAYRLQFKEGFSEVFRHTISKLIEKELPATVYLDSLDKMVVNQAETSTNLQALKEVREESEAQRTVPGYQSAPAFSTVNGTDIWLRSFLLERSVMAIASALMHEAAHLAGAPAHMLAEFCLEAIHNAGYPRIVK